MAVNWDEFKPVGEVQPQAGEVDWDQFKPAPEKSGIVRRAVGDTAVTALKSAIAVPEAAVGIADIVTGGRAGKAIQDLGVDFKRAKSIADEWYSPEQQQANRNLQEAQGFGGTIQAAWENPSAVAHTIGESIGPMLAGGAVARGIGVGSALARGAIGEGVVSAGMQAEGLRQENADGLLTPKQSLSAVGSGAGTGIITRLSGGLAKKLGIEDVDTLLAGGTTAAGKAGLLKRAGQGILTEGALEEMPQSAQEQMWQNVAADRPLMEGVPEASALGLVTGGIMGGGVGALRSGSDQPTVDPSAGPLSRAAATAQTTGAAQAAQAQQAASMSAEQMRAKPDVPPAGSFSDMNEFADFITQERADVERMRNPPPFEEMTGIAAGFDPATRARNQVPAPSGSFGQMNEFADLLGQEQADVTQRREAIADRQALEGESQLESIAGQIEDNRQQQGIDARRSLLDTVLNDPETKNPLPRFESMLKRQGFAQRRATDEERQAIERFQSAGEAFADMDRERAAPNELDAAAMGIRERKPIIEPGIKADNSPRSNHRPAFPMTQEGAQRRAAEQSQATGTPHEVAPHPTVKDRFTVQAVVTANPSPERVAETPEIEQVAPTNALLSAGEIGTQGTSNEKAAQALPPTSQRGAAQQAETVAEQVRDATPREAAVADRAEPVLDLNKRPTGWKQVDYPNGDGVLLISSDGKKAINFPSRNAKSGTESLRAQAKAQSFAIDNPHASNAPQGELVVQPIFGKQAQQAEVTPTAQGADVPVAPKAEDFTSAGAFHSAMREWREKSGGVKTPEAQQITPAAEIDKQITNAKKRLTANEKKRGTLVPPAIIDEVSAKLRAEIAQLNQQRNAPADQGTANAPEPAQADQENRQASRAQAAPQGGAQESGQGVGELRTKLQAVERDILAAAPQKFSVGGGDIEGAMRSLKVPRALKEQRKAIKEQLRTAQAPRSDLDTVAERVTEPTHADPGEQSEAATAPVIREALQKSARNTEFNAKEAKAWLLGEIDRAIAEAPTANRDMAADLAQEKARTFKLSERVAKLGKGSIRDKLEREERDAFDAMQADRIAKTARMIGFVTFDVPGDGKFKVVNTPEAIEAFRDKVKASPGFRDNPTVRPNFGTGTAGGPSLDESLKKLGNTPDALQEIGNAIEIARLKKAKDEDKLLDRFREASNGKDYDAWRAEQDAAEEIDRRESAQPAPTETAQAEQEEGADRGADTATAEQPSEVATEAAGKGRAKPKLEDFGEKLDGAKKFMRQQHLDALADDALDIATEPLAKTFPVPNYAKLADEGVPSDALAFIALARNAIPAKPRVGYKLKRWVEQVKQLRSLAHTVLSGEVTFDKMQATAEGSSAYANVRGLFYTATAIKDIQPDLLPQAAKWRIEARGGYSIYRDLKITPGQTVYSLENPKGRDAGIYGTDAADVVERAAEAIRSAVEAEADKPAERRLTKLSVYSDRYTKDIFIGFKGMKDVVRLKTGFANATDARSYIAENQAALQATIDEMRAGPQDRRPNNRPRQGPPHREGDATPEMFASMFSFRGVQFGSYVEGDRRQAELNEAYDALMDLADVLAIPPKALSLNGSLGLAFGARGSGNAKAHFEPGNVVINLTKTKGAGSLAHEWLHALDNYLDRQSDGSGKSTGFLSNRNATGAVRAELFSAWKAVQKAFKRGGFLERAQKYDAARSKPYWSTDIEMAARSFERYILDRIEQRGGENDYLVNVYKEGGAYPTDAEMVEQGITSAYDRLFETIDTRDTDKGVALFSRDTPSTGTTESAIRSAIASLIGPMRSKRVIVAQTADELVRQGIITAEQANGAQAFVKDGKAYFIADQIAPGNERAVFLHEAGSHLGLEKILSPFARKVLLTKIRNWAQESGTVESRIAQAALRRVEAAGETGSDAELLAYTVEEAVKAGIDPTVETQSALGKWFAQFMAAMRKALESLGLVNPKQLTAQDIVNLARGAARVAMEQDGTAGGAQFSRDQTRTEDDARISRMDDADEERLAAEQEAAALRVSLGEDADESAIHAMSDDELRKEFARLRALQRESARTLLAAQKATLDKLKSRMQYKGDLDDLRDVLSEKYDIRVASDGLIEVGRITSTAERLIQDLPIAMYHHTATGILPLIRKEGLRVGKQTNFFNTQQGVYVTTIAAGVPVTTYSSRAAKVHGGEPTTLRVRRTLDQIKPDPDDADLAWAQGKQYITPSVPAADIVPDPNDSRIQFSRAPGSIAPVWDVPESSKLFNRFDTDSLLYTLQDKHIDTKRVVEAIRKQAGDIEDEFNPYLQEELFHGRSAKGVKDFLDAELRPLLAEMTMRKVTMADLESYLHARHAEERNIQIAKINPKMPDGGSGMTTQDAKDYLTALDPAKRATYDALAKRIDAINKATRDLLVDAGLEKRETIDAWEGAYQHYVPLQREEVDADGMRIGQGFSVKGSASKRAMGSDKTVVDILANIAMQRERAIVRAEKNRVAQALYGLSLKAPNPEFWMTINPAEAQAFTPKQQQTVIDELTSLGLDPADAMNFVKEPTQRYIDPRTGLVASRINPVMRSAANVLSVRVNGEDRYVFFNQGDERANRMVQALKNLDADQLGRLLQTSAKLTRLFASVNTQWNPVFGAINILRDVQGAMLNLSTTPLRGKEGKVLADTLSALKGIYTDLRAVRKGGAATSQWASLWEEFQKEGGQTGYRDMFSNAAQRAEAIEKELKQINEGKLKHGARAVFDWLSDYNEAMENAVRLAAYKEAKDAGLSNAQAASLAKNLTVNFNRKGQIATQAGALYAFYNAASQGTFRMAQTLRGPAGRKIIAGGLILGSMQAVLLAAAGFDDDEPPEFVRERSIIIPTGGGKYLSIPMPLGFNVIPNISRITTEWAMSGFKDTGKRISSLLGLFADTFNPIGNAGISMQTLTPTALDPFAALAENKDWTGKPIAREDMSSLDPTPGFTRAKDTASVVSKTLAYWANLATGGTDYKPGLVSFSPDQLDYLIGQFTGGVGREYLKIEQTVTSLATGEDLPAHKVPLFGRFYGDTTGQASEANRFYNNLREVNLHKSEIDGRRKAGEDVMGYLQDNPTARLSIGASRYETQIRKLKQARRAAMQNDADPEVVRNIDAQITATMQNFNQRFAQLEAR